MTHYMAHPFTARELADRCAAEDAMDDARFAAALREVRDDAARMNADDWTRIIRTLDQCDAPTDDASGRPLTVPERLDAMIEAWDTERDALNTRLDALRGTMRGRVTDDRQMLPRSA